MKNKGKNIFFCLSIIPKFPKISENDKAPRMKYMADPFNKKFPILNPFMGLFLNVMIVNNNSIKFSMDARMARAPLTSKNSGRYKKVNTFNGYGYAEISKPELESA